MQNEPLDLRCKKCGKVAQFFEPFRFTCVIRHSELPPHSHLWGRVIVEELFPEEFPWQQPATDKPRFLYDETDSGEGYRLNHVGMVSCPCCNTVEKAEISWPQDAYWKWDIDGHELVARNRAHAELMLGYIREQKRSPHKSRSLKTIPTALLTKRMRPVIEQVVEADLALADA